MIDLYRPLLIGCLLMLVGCEPAQEAHETVHDAARTTIAQIDRAEVLSDLAQARPAIQAYQNEKQTYPATLGELNLKLNHPEDLIYDPATGKLSSRTFPGLK